MSSLLGIYVVVFCLAVGIGTLAAILGVGGGSFLVPALMFSGLSAHLAVGTGVSSAMFIGASSLIEYGRQRRVDWKLGLLLEGFTVPGSILGAYATKYVSPRGLEALFAFMLIIVSFVMFRNPSTRFGRSVSSASWMRKIVDKDGEEIGYNVKTAPAFLFSFLAGVSVGFFGISGGVLKVPILVFSGVPIHVAVATSSFMISMTAATAFICHTLLGNVNYYHLSFLAPGVVLGAQVGARISRKARPKILRRTFSMVLLGAAVALLLRSEV